MFIKNKFLNKIINQIVYSVKYDATVNDVPKLFPLDGFPTIYLIR